MRQLIFTSAPRGLEGGRAGFCTVARSPDLRDRLVRELERLSAYDPPRQRRPVILRHRKVTLGADSWHVLTRFVGGGRDYTQRAAHLAHHVVLTPAEALAWSSPAAVFAAAGWREGWDEAPRLLGEPDRLRPASPPPRWVPARSWAERTGDAAHAARLAATVPLRRPQRLLPGPGEEGEALRPLLAEALALLPPVLAWQATFTTTAQGADEPRDHLWTVVPADASGDLTARFAAVEAFDLGPAAGRTAAPLDALALLARHGALRLTAADLPPALSAP